MKIFYSWQDDIEKKYNRFFIKDALEKAIEQLNKEFKIEDAIRIDHDTKGIKGSPDITNTILKKIRECDIFIGDISFIAKSKKGKYCPNPNVLIELGYAFNCLTDERVVNVINTAYSAPEELPFNLKGKRWPIKFELSDNNKSMKADVRKSLIASLKSALIPFIGKQMISKPEIKSAAERIQHREKLRKEFEKKLFEMRKAKKSVLDIIIRDIDRVDGYPNIDEKESGISAWFQSNLLETYTRGVRVLLKIGMLTQCENGFRYTDYNNSEKGDVKALLIGEISYDSIVAINWEGDEYYYSPNIYCYFNYDSEPYERLIFCEKVETGDGHIYYREFSDFNSIKKNSEKLGIKEFY